MCKNAVGGSGRTIVGEQMKASVLVELLRQGKKPVVRLTGNLCDDSFGDKGMIARVVSATEEKHEKYSTVELGFDLRFQ